MAANIAMVVFTVVGIGGGVAMLKWTDPIFRFFKSGMDTMTMYPKRIRDAAMQRRGVRVAGVGWILFGVLSLVILIWRLTNGYGFM